MSVKSRQLKRRRDRGEDSIYQRASDHRWIVEIRDGYKPSGRPNIIYLTAKGYPDDTRENRKRNTEARAKLLVRRDETKAQIRKGVPVSDEIQTVASYLRHWLEYTVKPSKRPRTYEAYESLVRVHIIPILGRKHLAKLTPLDVQEMMGRMLKGGRHTGWVSGDALTGIGSTETRKIGRACRLTRRAKLRSGAAESYDSVALLEAGVHATIVAGPIDVDGVTWWQIRTSGVSSTTVKNARGVLRKALNDAMRDDLISRNVVTLTDMPAQRTFHAKPLTQDEVPRFLAQARGHRLEALWLTFLIAGLRAGEAFGLRWQDVDLEHGELRVRYQLQRIGTPKRAVFVDPKTEQSRRPIPLPSQLVDALRAHRERQEEERMIAGSRWQGTEWQDLVFCTTIGTPLDQSNVIKQYREVLASAGLDTDRRVHDLRHTCATMLARLGVHPRQAQEILRHAQISTTLAIYTHVGADSVRSAVDQLGAMMTRKEGEE